MGPLTDTCIFGEISVRMETLVGWHTKQIIHRTDQFAGKFHQTDTITKFIFDKTKINSTAIMRRYAFALQRFVFNPRSTAIHH